MNFAVVNLGCKVNRVESDDAAARLALRGVETSEASADLIVVNTCTVTGEAEKKTRKAVRRALRANDHARVLVTGCAAAIDAAFYEALDERVSVVGKAQLAQAIDVLFDEAPFSPGEDAPLHIGSGFRTRVGVKVQDGCDNACTYCIVHVARGRATSRPADDVVRECASYARAGAREIVLTGINLGSYCDGGRRDPSAIRLAALLRRLLDETADLHAPGEAPARFRVSSIEPRDVDDALIDLLASADGRVCRHLHLPLQAGSSKVLREMARPYDAERFVRLQGSPRRHAARAGRRAARIRARPPRRNRRARLGGGGRRRHDGELLRGARPRRRRPGRAGRGDAVVGRASPPNRRAKSGRAACLREGSPWARDAQNGLRQSWFNGGAVVFRHGKLFTESAYWNRSRMLTPSPRAISESASMFGFSYLP